MELLKKRFIRGQVTTLGAVVIAALTMLGSVMSARITSSSVVQEQNIEQDKKIQSLEKDVDAVSNSLDSIQRDVKIIKCAVIGRNDQSIFNECKSLNQ